MFRPRCSESILERDQVDPGLDLEGSEGPCLSWGEDAEQCSRPALPCALPAVFKHLHNLHKVKRGLFLFRRSAARVI